MEIVFVRIWVAYVFLFCERGHRYSPAVQFIPVGNPIVSSERVAIREEESATRAYSVLTLKEVMAKLDDMELVPGNECDDDKSDDEASLV